jgi:hypothetical protein
MPTSAKFESFFTYLCFKIRLDYQPAMEIVSPTVTTPRSTRSFEPAATSTPALGGVESLSLSEDPSFEASMNYDHSMEDESAQKCVEAFVRSTCGCKLGPRDSPCSSFLTKETIEKCRADNLELGKDELDLVILAQIRAGRSVDSQRTLRNSHHEKTTNRSMSKYYIHGVLICRKTFMFLHCVGHKRLEHLIRHFDGVGVDTRQHGNSKRLPKNTTPYEEVNRLTLFITNYARAHGLPLPGRVPGHRDKTMVLPSDVTKALVYSKYKSACEENEWEAVGRSKFYDVWSELLPHISISTPSSDLCFTCQQNALAIQKSGCLSEEEKSECFESAQEHLRRAKTERDYYKSQVEAAESAEQTSSSRIAHYSYDFAQQIHYPYDSQQTGPEYFKTARKCGLFGVSNDGKRQMVLYLIDEAENPGKGADCVISLLHHYFTQHSHERKCVYLHADNCVGQNKNNAAIQYLVWRVLNGYEESIELSFMLVGHTKFSPDRYFGLFKKVFRRSSVSTLAEISAVADRATTSGQIVPQVIRDVAGKKLVTFYQWSAYLGQFFRTIPNITSYHNFKVSSDGTVTIKQYSDSSEEKIKLLKPNVQVSDLKGQPKETEIPGLDLNRQWYLYDSIRIHCKSTLAADLTCPRPSQPKPTTKTSKSAPQTPSTSSTASLSASGSSTIAGKRKRTTTCGLCHAVGHTKRTCPNK